MKHISRHKISPEEVEAVCHGSPLVLIGQKKGRLILLGQTAEKQILAVVLEAQGNGRYYPITAYQADKKDIALYNRLKGGEK